MINSKSSIYSLWIKVKPASMSGNDYQGFNSPVSIKTCCLNHLSVTVTIVERSGLKYDLQPLYDSFQSELIIRYGLEMSPIGAKEIEKVLTKVDESSSETLKVLKELFKLRKQNVPYKSGAGNMVIDYNLTIKELRGNGGLLYLPQADILVSLHGFENTPPHPYSEEGLRDNTINTVYSTLDSDCVFTIQMIDNQTRFGPRFANINGRVIKIRPIRDITKKDGIYIVTNTEYNGEGAEQLKTYKDMLYFEIDEEGCGLFKTFEEAKEHGDIGTANKLKLAKLETELSESKAQLAREKHDFDIRKLQKEKEVSDAKDLLEKEKELHQRDIEKEKERQERDRSLFTEELNRMRELRKEYFEDKSQNRKDSGELLKWLPTIIGAVISIAAVLASTNKK